MKSEQRYFGFAAGDMDTRLPGRVIRNSKPIRLYDGAVILSPISGPLEWQAAAVQLKCDWAGRGYLLRNKVRQGDR